MVSNSPLDRNYPIGALVLGSGDGIDHLREVLGDIDVLQNVTAVDNAHYAWGMIRDGRINTIFVDPFSLRGGVEEAVLTILGVRAEFPEIAFVLYVDNAEYESNKEALLSGEGKRLAHYFRLDRFDRDDDGVHYRLRDMIRRCQDWHQAIADKRPSHKLYEFDVALSFAGEDRDFVEEVAERLTLHGVRVFYDSYEQANLWGKNLFEHLHDVYSKKARYCMMFVSAEYAEKMWTVHERRSAQERTLQQRDSEYVLPVRIDDTELPGLPTTVAYLNSNEGVHRICKLFIEKLGGELGSLS